VLVGVTRPTAGSFNLSSPVVECWMSVAGWTRHAPCVSWASPTCMVGGGVDYRGWQSWCVRPPPSSRVHVMQIADGPMTLKMWFTPTVPCTAVLVRGAHNTPGVQHVLLIRGYIRTLSLRDRGEGGNWTHERKSENLINEHAHF
jgi:hypothetical protein